MKQFFGKYRGTVANNADPRMQGRIQVSVPAVLGDSLLSWAMPCVPYGGPQVGFFAVPPNGANVWVEFEGGDPDYPIWTGCFWGDGEAPVQPAPPTMKVLQPERDRHAPLRQCDLGQGRAAGQSRWGARAASGQPGDLHADGDRPDRRDDADASEGDLMSMDFPFHFDERGRTAEVAGDARIRALIEQVLFTTPGERVNRPDFGSGALELVFAPNDDALAAATQMAVQGALQQWLGDLIQVEAVDVQSDDARLIVSVDYTVLRTQQQQSARFTRGGPT